MAPAVVTPSPSTANSVVAGVVSVQWIKGHNTFTFGGEARRSYQDDNECQFCGGEFNFSAAHHR